MKSAFFTLAITPRTAGVTMWPILKQKGGGILKVPLCRYRERKKKEKMPQGHPGSLRPPLRIAAIKGKRLREEKKISFFFLLS